MEITGLPLAYPKFPYTKLRGWKFPASVDGADVDRVRLLEECSRKYGRLSERMRMAAKSHDATRQMAVAREWEKSWAARVWAGVEVNARLSPQNRLTLQTAMGLTEELYLNRRPNEIVIARQKPKANGGFRTYCEFGFQHRVLHQLMRTLYLPFLVPKPFQYEFRRKGKFAGISLAIKEIRDAILGGYVWFAHLDIDAYFPSFKEQEQHLIVPGLRRVTLHNTGGHLNIVPKGPKLSLSTISSDAHRGAPQGSALSALLAAIVISRLEWKCECLLFNWADNFLILGQSKIAVEMATKALKAQVAGLPGGDFSLSAIETGRARDGFVFLGHSIRYAHG